MGIDCIKLFKVKPHEERNSSEAENHPRVSSGKSILVSVYLIILDVM